MRASSALLPGDVLRPTSGQVAKRMASGCVIKPTFAAQETVPPTGAFGPLLLGEGLGGFATGLDREALMRDGFAVVGEGAIPAVELQQPRSATQAGLTAAVAADGWPQIGPKTPKTRHPRAA